MELDIRPKQIIGQDFQSEFWPIKQVALYDIIYNVVDASMHNRHRYVFDHTERKSTYSYNVM